MKTIRDLTKKHCTPSKTGGKALTVSQLKKYLAVVPHWLLAADGKCIRRELFRGRGSDTTLQVPEYVREVLLEQDAESGWIVQRCAEHLAIRVDLTHHLVLVTRRGCVPRNLAWHVHPAYGPSARPWIRVAFTQRASMSPSSRCVCHGTKSERRRV